MNEHIANLYFPVSYSGSTSPSQARSDPYGYPIPELHFYQPDSVGDSRELFNGWHDWGVELNNGLSGIFEIANEFETGLDRITHQASHRDSVEVVQSIAQFLLNVRELQFNKWIPNRSPFPTRSDVSSLVIEAKGGKQFRGECAAYDFVFLKAFHVAHVIENSFGFSQDVRQLKQRLLTTNRSNEHNVPWGCIPHFVIGLGFAILFLCKIVVVSGTWLEMGE